MNEANAPDLGAAVGARIRELREQRGMSQDDLASRARVAGLDWDQAKVSRIEAGERRVTLEELFILSLRLPVQLLDLVPDVGWIQLSPTLNIQARALRALLRGLDGGDLRGGTDWIDSAARASVAELIAPQARREVVEEVTARVWPAAPLDAVIDAAEAMHGDAEQKGARRLGVDKFELALRARRLWGRSLTEERNRRLDADGHGSKQALRGHITRTLLAELRETMREAS